MGDDRQATRRGHLQLLHSTPGRTAARRGRTLRVPTERTCAVVAGTIPRPGTARDRVPTELGSACVSAGARSPERLQADLVFSLQHAQEGWRLEALELERVRAQRNYAVALLAGVVFALVWLVAG